MHSGEIFEASIWIQTLNTLPLYLTITLSVIWLIALTIIKIDFVTKDTFSFTGTFPSRLNHRCRFHFLVNKAKPCIHLSCFPLCLRATKTSMVHWFFQHRCYLSSWWKRPRLLNENNIFDKVFQLLCHHYLSTHLKLTLSFTSLPHSVHRLGKGRRSGIRKFVAASVACPSELLVGPGRVACGAGVMCVTDIWHLFIGNRVPRQRSISLIHWHQYCIFRTSYSLWLPKIHTGII